MINMQKNKETEKNHKKTSSKTIFFQHFICILINITKTKGNALMGKLVEGLWDCPFCNNKRIRAGQKTCPNCGHPQDESTKFYMPDTVEYVPEEKAAKISRNPDWQCSFCGSLNSDNLYSCKNCGATKEDSERNYFEMRQQEEEKKRKKEEQKAAFRGKVKKEAPKKKEKVKKSLIKRVLLFFGIIAAIIFGMIACFAPTVKNVTIDDFDWERTIDIEEIVTHNESDWSLPDGARLQHTKNEIKTYKDDVLDHYETVTETKTRSVIDHYEEYSSYKDLGNGYFEEQTESVPVYTTETYTEDVQKPVYRQEPVYATKYYYEIDRWTVVDTAKSSGHDQNPSWPEPKLKDGQRTGDENEHYFVTATYQKKKDKTETEKYEMTFSEWKELKKGEEIELKIDVDGFAEINKD